MADLFEMLFVSGLVRPKNVAKSLHGKGQIFGKMGALQCNV